MSLYSTLDLLLYKFITCLCKGDLTPLIIEGNPSTPELIAAWNTIYELFLDAMRDADGLYKVRLMAQINHLEFNYRLINLCVQFLSVAYTKQVDDIMRKHVRVNGPLNWEDRPAYLATLQVVINWSKRTEIEIADKRSEYAILEKADAPGKEKATEQQFDSLIGQISLFMKFRVNKMEIMTSEFICYYNMMRDHQTALENQLKPAR